MMFALDPVHRWTTGSNHLMTPIIILFWCYKHVNTIANDRFVLCRSATDMWSVIWESLWHCDYGFLKSSWNCCFPFSYVILSVQMLSHVSAVMEVDANPHYWGYQDRLAPSLFMLVPRVTVIWNGFPLWRLNVCYRRSHYRPLIPI